LLIRVRKAAVICKELKKIPGIQNISDDIPVGTEMGQLIVDISEDPKDIISTIEEIEEMAKDKDPQELEDIAEAIKDPNDFNVTEWVEARVSKVIKSTAGKDIVFETKILR